MRAWGWGGGVRDGDVCLRGGVLNGGVYLFGGGGRWGCFGW